MSNHYHTFENFSQDKGDADFPPDEERKGKKKAEPPISDRVLKKVQAAIDAIGANDYLPDEEESNEQSVQHRNARLGYARHRLEENGPDKFIFRTENARFAHEGDVEELARSFIQDGIKWNDVKEAIPLLVDPKFLAQGCYRKTHGPGVEPKVLKFIGHDDPNFKVIVLGGNHRRLAYQRRDKIIKEKYAIIERAVNVLKSTDRASLDQDVQTEADKKIQTAEALLSRFRNNLSDDHPWLFEILNISKCALPLLYFCLLREFLQTKSRTRFVPSSP